MTYNDVANLMQKSSWPEDVQQALTPAMSRLGRWALAYLSQQLSSIGSEFIAEEIAVIINQEPEWYEMLQNSRTDQIVGAVQHIIDSGEEEQHKALLAVILDIRTNKAMAALVPPDLSSKFDELELLYLRNLPVSEVAAILNSRIEHIYGQADLQLEIKRYCYYRDSLNKDDVEIKTFKKSLETNMQTIGNSSMTVKGWIEMFMESAAATADKSVYNVAHFITNNSQIKKLTAVEKNAISEILKLYNWFFLPYASSDEIEHYEKTRLNDLESQSTQPPAAQIAPEPQSELPQQKLVTEHIDAPELKPLPRTSPQGLRLNKATDSDPMHAANPGEIHDIINRSARPKVGLVLDPTNIQLSDEKARLEQERSKQGEQIQRKLIELRKRNNQQ